MAGPRALLLGPQELPVDTAPRAPLAGVSGRVCAHEKTSYSISTRRGKAAQAGRTALSLGSSSGLPQTCPCTVTSRGRDQGYAEVLPAMRLLGGPIRRRSVHSGPGSQRLPASCCGSGRELPTEAKGSLKGKRRRSLHK